MNRTLAGTFGFVLLVLGLGMALLGLLIVGNALILYVLGLFSFAGAYVFLGHAFDEAPGCPRASMGAQPGTAPDAGPAEQFGDSGVGGRPPSVS